MPAAPIRHLILSWLDGERDPDAAKHDPKQDAFLRLAFILFPELSPRQGKDKIRAILGLVGARSTTIDFDLADLVLCRLEQPELWLEDPVLHEAYMSVDFAALDRARPVVTCAA